MSAEVYFENIAEHILDRLNDASHSVRVAVAWFTDRLLFNALIKKASEGITVIVIIRNDVINLGHAGLQWQELLNKGGTLFLSPYSPALHHKFCLIDDNELISGSYNWTYGARRNRENAVLSQQSDLVKSFRAEWNHLLDSASEVTDLAAAIIALPPISDVMLQQQAVEEEMLKFESNLQHKAAKNYEELVLSAEASYRRMDYREAVSELQKAIEIRPNGKDAHILLAGVFWRTGQYQDSVIAAKEAERCGISDPALWNSYGLAFDGLGKYKEAIAYFDLCIKAEPDISTWYYNKCFSLDKWGRETLGDKAATEGITVASNEIKQNRNGGDRHRLLRAYIERGGLNRDKPEARKDASLAREIFEKLSDTERDMHDLEDISKLLK